MLSLCSDASLRLLNTPGKSGAFFFLSHDDKVGAGPGGTLTRVWVSGSYRLISDGSYVDWSSSISFFNTSASPTAQFFVKSLKKGETTLLYNILPEYYKHVSSHPHTLITRFYGLHRIILSGGRKVQPQLCARSHCCRLAACCCWSPFHCPHDFLLLLLVTVSLPS